MTRNELLWTYANQRESEQLWHNKIQEIRVTIQAIEKELS